MASRDIAVAAIDAGSNGMRVVVANADAQGRLTKLDGYRKAIRLGTDAFSTGTLSAQTIARTVDAFREFEATLVKHGVAHLRAVATSAARTAKNRRDLVDAIAEATGIELEIIGGLEEAQLVYAGVADAVDLGGESALLIDMGGGSVEITVVADGQPLGCETLPLGTVRLLNALTAHKMDEQELPTLLAPFRHAARALLTAEIGGAKPDVCVATGGNPECIGKLRAQLLDRDDTKRVKPTEVEEIADAIGAMSVEERASELGLREDRADIIGIATRVLAFVLDGVEVDQVLIPRVGLKDGLLKEVARNAFPRNRKPKKMPLHKDAENA